MSESIDVQRCSISGQTPREELVNVLTHGFGAVLSLGGLVVLIVFAALYGDAWAIVSCSVYASTLLLVYVFSTIYHSFRSPRVKKVFKIIDHSCIYLLIAGTYTPFTLVALRGGLGWSLFGIIWGSALLGIIFKIFFSRRFKILSTIMYVALGWMAMIAIKPLYEFLSTPGFWLFIIGGLSYTLGALFYATRRVPYSHGVFHVFVIIGSVCHYFSVMSLIIWPG